MKAEIKNLGLALAICPLLLFGSTKAIALQTSETSKILIDDLVANIQQTLLAVAKAEQKAGNSIEDMRFELAVPARLSSNFGLVLEPNESKGLQVLSISPGSLAEDLKIEQGDHIVSINAVSLEAGGTSAVLNELQDLTPGENITIGLDRGGKRSALTTVVNGEYLPAFRLEIGQADLSNELAEGENICGTVSVFFSPPETKRFYDLVITHIDDRKVLSSKARYRLAPGKYTLRVQEQISDPLLKRSRTTIQRPKLLEVEVKANHRYDLAAKFITEKRLRPQTNEFWEPVIWKVDENSPCEL
jgi:hypothetical protein